jgi:hypothetical protein
MDSFRIGRAKGEDGPEVAADALLLFIGCFQTSLTNPFIGQVEK